MYIVKPQKGFVIPVEYIINENLFDDNLKDLRSGQMRKITQSDDVERNNVFIEKDDMVQSNAEIVQGIVSDRLFDDIEDDYDGGQDNSVIMAVLEEKNNREEISSGMLVFDDVIAKNDIDIEIDDDKSRELERVMGNYRKAIEVEIQKVGKLVLDDTETEISSKASVKSADVQIDNAKADELEENIVTDDAREDSEEESANEVNSENTQEADKVESSSNDDK